jgi:hypothetical protein
LLQPKVAQIPIIFNVLTAELIEPHPFYETAILYPAGFVHGWRALVYAEPVGKRWIIVLAHSHIEALRLREKPISGGPLSDGNSRVYLVGLDIDHAQGIIVFVAHEKTLGGGIDR